jgi:hypothetical protein
MKRFMCILVFAATASAADWTGAMWTNLGTWNEGLSPLIMRGLNCSGDTVFMLISQADAQWNLHVDLFRWAPVMNSVERLPIPDSTALYWEINQDYPNHSWPVLMNSRDAALWRYRSGTWEARSLREAGDDSLMTTDGFCFDSTGALHYGWFDHDSTTAHYRRRGGGKPNRDTSFVSQIGSYGFNRYNAKMLAPTSSSVLWFVQGYRNTQQFITSYSIYASEGDSPFVFHPVEGAGLSGSFTQHDSRGNWMYAYEAGYYRLGVLGGHATEFTVPVSNPALTSVVAYSPLANPADSSFELAVLVGSVGYATLNQYRYNWDLMQWDWQFSCPTPSASRTMHYMIDQQGYGHLFVLDATSIWHFGRLELTAHERTLPIPQQLTIAVYPNPFNSTTTIKLELPSYAQRVDLTFYNLEGREVLRTELHPAGSSFEYRLDASAWSSGVYLLRAQSQNYSAMQKLLLLK